jgi:prepilin-type processing-associated H-X9-DG protein
MRGSLKILVALGVAAAAAALLLVLYAGSRRRGLEAHCRNNLRHLGRLAADNWGGLDPARTGRDFWQNVREGVYRYAAGANRGTWKKPYQGLRPEDPRALPDDPFLCPVHGRGVSRPEDAAAIDYLGPRSVREEAAQVPRSEPLGADRAGNHPSGGNVLYLDGSAREIPAIVERRGGGEAAWAEALRLLKD